MRALEFIIETQVLDEIDMSPSSLKQLAAGTGAVAGMEFEMYVPDVADDEDEEEGLEPDYDEDIRAQDIDDIISFFDDGDHNSRRELRDLEAELRGEYQEWVDEYVEQDWEENRVRYLAHWIVENVPRNDIVDALGVDTKQWIENHQMYELAKKVIEEGPSNHWYESAYDEYRESRKDNYEEGSWLRANGIRYMSDVESAYNVIWPYWTRPDSGGERDIKQVALQFMTDLGLNNIAVSDSYHGDYYVSSGGNNWKPIGDNKPNDTYTVEPDGSLRSKKSNNDAGLEFVSNPLPLDEMIASLNEVVEWAKTNGCYTNQSTGLHMNVSVPGCSREKLDYVKLALLLGDEYVLNQFGRAANSFTKSAMSNLKSRATYMQSEPELLTFFDQMRNGLSVEAAKLIHSGVTGKYVSINAKEGYIEFRSPGGDWLNEDIPKLENTLLRFVVALDAACDPQKYRTEYLKKLYKLLAPKTKGDVLDVFAKYSSGQLQKQDLVALLKRSRGIQKPIQPIQAKVSAGPAEPAFGQPPSRNTEYQIYDSRTGEEYELFQAQSDEEALNRLDDYRRMARNSASSLDPNRFVLRHQVN